MRVLVTGASSLLGGATARLLRDRGDDVTVFQRRPAGLDGCRELLGDITDAAAVATACRGQQAVVHLAARVSVVGPEAAFLAVNVAGTSNVLAAARDAGVERVVHVSSPSVAHVGSPLVGAPAGPADPVRARGHYARTKALAEQRALAADGPDLPVLVIRPHLVWGPGDTQLIARIVARARAGRLAIIGHGAALIDSTFLDDAAAALVAAVDAVPRVHGQALVVTGGEPRPVAELLTRICQAAGVPPPRRRVPRAVAWAAGAVAEGLWTLTGRDDDPPVTRFVAEQLSTAHWFDQRRTRALLGWAPAVGIEEGLVRLGEWYAGGGHG